MNALTFITRKLKSSQTIFALALSAIVFYVQPAFAAKQVIKHAQVSVDQKEALVFSILQLAIEKSGNADKYEFEEFAEYTTEERLVNWLNDGTLSVFWAGTQPQYEEKLHPIRIPVLKGLLGHRIFIIRDGDQSRFDAVNNLRDLKDIPLGQGRFWGDTAVLKSAGMDVVDPVKYTSLFPMLEGSRFDYFPRAVLEPWSEVAKHHELNLAVEEKHMLVYPFAMYFFVSKDNIAFGKDIERGFMNAIEDGSYDELFFSSPVVREALTKSNLSQRKVYRLDNPNMTAETPVDDKRLWLNIDEIDQHLQRGSLAGY